MFQALLASLSLLVVGVTALSDEPLKNGQYFHNQVTHAWIPLDDFDDRLLPPVLFYPAIVLAFATLLLEFAAAALNAQLYWEASKLKLYLNGFLETTPPPSAGGGKRVGTPTLKSRTTSGSSTASRQLQLKRKKTFITLETGHTLRTEYATTESVRRQPSTLGGADGGSSGGRGGGGENARMVAYIRSWQQRSALCNYCDLSYELNGRKYFCRYVLHPLKEAIFTGLGKCHAHRVSL
jgi:hypothetical protein